MEFANDLLFEQFAAALQEAGYDVPLYSAECDHGDHVHCARQEPNDRDDGESPTQQVVEPVSVRVSQ